MHFHILEQWFSKFGNMIYEPATSASPGALLEIQIFSTLCRFYCIRNSVGEAQQFEQALYLTVVQAEVWKEGSHYLIDAEQ